MKTEVYNVIVPYRRRGKLRAVSYPASGFPLYTRERAIEILRIFEKKRGKIYGDELEPWADGPGDRFTLEDIDAPDAVTA